MNTRKVRAGQPAPYDLPPLEPEPEEEEDFAVNFLVSLAIAGAIFLVISFLLLMLV